MLIMSTMTAMMSVALVRMYHRPPGYPVSKLLRTILRLLLYIKCENKVLTIEEDDRKDNKEEDATGAQKTTSSKTNDTTEDWKNITAQLDSALFCLSMAVSLIITIILIILFIVASCST